MEGAIHLKLGSKIPEDTALMLEFKGVEKTRWMIKSPNIGEDQLIESLGRRDVINVSQVLHTFKENKDNLSSIVDTKQFHIFPFEIPLPVSLPSSLSYYFGSKNRMIIKYKLKASLKKLFGGDDGPSSGVIEELSTRMRVQIQQRTQIEKEK